MNKLTDQQLLHAYADGGSEAAFAELVGRYVDLIYSAAFRMVRDAHLAEDVTQSVFIACAKNARELIPHPALAAWLHRTAQNLAAKTVRTEVRRFAREHDASAMNKILSTTEGSTWEQIALDLDAAMNELSEPDREVLLLRYFRRKSAREMAGLLGTSEDTAQKRVTRAVNRLRDLFTSRGVTVESDGLISGISANGVQAAPIGLTVAISVAVAGLAGSAAASTGATLTAAKILTMTTLQKTLVAVVLTAAVGTGIYEAHQAATLRAQVVALQETSAPLAEVAKLRRERDEAVNQLASLREENMALNSNTAEVLKLRNEVSLLRRDQRPQPGPSDYAPSQESTRKGQETSPVAASENVGREVGMAVLRGDPGAFEKLRELSDTVHQIFNANSIGLSNNALAELSVRTFAPLQAAFDVIREAAVKNDPTALNALGQAIQIPNLKGMAVQAIGILAGEGNETAIAVLLDPEKYSLPQSTVVSALGPAAAKGNQRAIDALSLVVQDVKQRGYWMMAAGGLSDAAKLGNVTAIDALVGLSSSTDQNVQRAITPGLERAAANQNARAAAALHSMGVQ